MSTPVELYTTESSFKHKPKVLEDAFWHSCSNGEFTKSAVYASIITYHENMVARANIRDEGVIPGNFSVPEKIAFIPLESKRISPPTYELLSATPGSLIWVPSQDGMMHPNAVIGGKTLKGEVLLIGRTLHNDVMVPGKIIPSLKALVVAESMSTSPYRYQHYEILVGVHPSLPPTMTLAEVTFHSSKSKEKLHLYADDYERRRDDHHEPGQGVPWQFKKEEKLVPRSKTEQEHLQRQRKSMAHEMQRLSISNRGMRQ